MTQRQVADLFLDHDPPVQRLTLLSTLYAVSAALCVVGASLSPAAINVRGVFWFAGVVGVLGAVGLWIGRRRHHDIRLPQAGLLFYSVMTAVLAAFSATATGVATLSSAVILTSVYAGYFFTGRALWLQIGVAVGTYALGAVIAAPPVTVIAILTVALAGLAIAVILNGLQRSRVRRDPLTGALSRATWLGLAARTLPAHPDRPVAVALLDLDHFKHTNDTLGHDAGDELLREVATVWTRTVGRVGSVGRYGGDEFVVLFPNAGPGRVYELLHHLRQAHPAPWTAGLAFARPEDDVQTLVARADRELHTSKAQRRRS